MLLICIYTSDLGKRDLIDRDGSAGFLTTIIDSTWEIFLYRKNDYALPSLLNASPIWIPVCTKLLLQPLFLRDCQQWSSDLCSRPFVTFLLPMWPYIWSNHPAKICYIPYLISSKNAVIQLVFHSKVPEHYLCFLVCFCWFVSCL